MDDKIFISDTNGVLVVSLIGSLEGEMISRVRSAIDTAVEKSLPKQVNIDLSRLDFLDSNGLGVLIGRYEILKRKGIPLFIVNPSQATDRVLSQSGVYEMIAAKNV